MYKRQVKVFFLSKEKKMLEKLFLEMILYYSGDPKRIQHFTKVHSYAKLIGEREQLSPEELYILEAAAYTHDIGIKPAEDVYKRQQKAAQNRCDTISYAGMIHAAHEKKRTKRIYVYGKRICY